MHLTEPSRNTRIIGEFDVCVLGGSATGVFAAVRAARQGASVCIVEKQNSFGGVACSALVNVWHSLQDTVNERTIIAGLTREVVDRLDRRQAVRAAGTASVGFYLNTEELKIELDELVVENGVTPMLHCLFVAPRVNENRVEAVFVETKSGRGAIKARVFIDATGDGDLAARCGVPYGVDEHLQPPTTCAKIYGMQDVKVAELFREHREEYAMAEDAGWIGHVPGLDAVRMYALTHCFGTNAADAGQLTAAEIEGRRHIRAIMDMVRTYASPAETPVLMSLPSYIGIRETRRFRTRHILTEAEVLNGVRFPDAVANGSYRVDVHHPSGGGFVFRYLDGTETDCRYGRHVAGRWRDPLPDGRPDPTFYQATYGMMVHDDYPNLLMAGRMVGSDKGAFGAIRVMVNLNQLGEAAGTAAAMACDEGSDVTKIDPARLRKKLADGGSVIL